MTSLSTSDLFVIALGLLLGTAYLFKDIIFASRAKDAPFQLGGKTNNPGSTSAGDEQVDPRDFVAKLQQTKKRLAIFYGSQTGTAEEYAIRLAKEAKSKFGLSSLVCDAEEYDIEKLDAVPEDSAVFFVMATYGEGEPTDNAVTLVQNLRDEEFSFSKGEHKLDGLKYVVFGLGNRTYEHYNIIGRQVDAALSNAGAVRIGERGEGDDDKSIEEDYLAWKDAMWEGFAKAMGVEEGAGAESPDFVVTEAENVDQNKVYLGELSARALNKTKGIHDAKNPFPAPIGTIKELFAVSHTRNCVHVEFNIEGSGLTYQHGDHVGVWPSNPDIEVSRLLSTLGLSEKAHTVIEIESLDSALAKVPFPVPTTYDAVLRHYIDISAVAGRQVLHALSRYAPSEEAAKELSRLGGDKEYYGEMVARPCLKLGEVLQLAAGDEVLSVSESSAGGGGNPFAKTTRWMIPFDVIVSAIPRLQPRYYSISSSPKLFPGSIHVTCVVLTYESEESSKVGKRAVYGIGSNYLFNLKKATHGELEAVTSSSSAPTLSNGSADTVVFANGGAADDHKVETRSSNPTYAIAGPRNAYTNATSLYKAPIHVRRSTFRLPTNPKTPVLLIGPGTGVAPFRGFIQERVALARKAIEKNGPEALSGWGTICLFYGCRSEHEDFLYQEEWPQYAAELGGKFVMHYAFSRSGPRKPDGSKMYVQDLIWEQREMVGKMIGEQKGYVFICGDAKSMSRAVEEVLARILGEVVKKEDIESGLVELKAMKERSRLLLDVWS